MCSVDPRLARCQRQAVHGVSVSHQHLADHVRREEAVGGDAGIGLEAGGELGRVADLRRGSRRSCRRRGWRGTSRSSTASPSRARVERSPKADSSSGTGAVNSLDRLARVGDHDEALGRRGDDLLAQVGAAAALDQPAVRRHLVGAVDRDVEPLERVELLDRDPQLPRLPLGRDRGRDAPNPAQPAPRKRRKQDARPSSPFPARPPSRPRPAPRPPRRRAASRV